MFHLIRRFVIVLLALVSVAITCDAKAKKSHKKDNRPRLDGIDMSHHQTDIKWDKIKKNKNIKFVYLKATEGASHIDEDYKKNVKNAKKHGVKVGAYHYYRAHSSTPEQQFANIKKNIKKSDCGFVPVIDVEIGHNAPIPKNFKRDLKKLLRLVENHYGVKPMIYVGKSFFNRYLDESFMEYPIWIAHYQEKKLDPKFKSCVIWQYGMGKMDFCKGRVDKNTINNMRSFRKIKWR